MLNNGKKSTLPPLRERQNTITTHSPTVDIDLKIFPNPFNNETLIQFDLKKPSTVQLQLFDLAGRYIKRVLPPSFHREGTHQVALQKGQLQAGIYFLFFNSPEGRVVKKVIISE